MKKLLSSKEIISEDFLNKPGTGVIINSKVKYKATYWDIDKVEDFEIVNGMKVYILSTKNGIAKIKKNLIV